jgi:predicted nucleotidyltransferase
MRDLVPVTSGVDPQGGLELLSVLDDAVGVLRQRRIPFLMIGGIASTVWGRDRGTGDIDVFVRPEAVPAVLDALQERGFDTSVEFEHWLYKGRRGGVTVDVIFRASRDILLDDEMLARASNRTFRGREIPIAPPEDLVVMKAISAGEDTARYWYDALAILSLADLDWDYLCARARQHGAKRVLSLMLFASSIDLVVPISAIEHLWRTVYGDVPAHE